MRAHQPTNQPTNKVRTYNYIHLSAPTYLGHDDAEVVEAHEDERLLPALRAEGGGVYACGFERVWVGV